MASTTTPRADVWAVVRWPLALVLMMAAMALLFRWSPRRHQPAWSWLAFGASVSVLLWSLVTLGLGLFFRASTSFGDTYGPLAGIVALLLWALLSAIALLFGGAVAAQLEAVRAGAPKPQDAEKVEHSEPDSAELAASRTGSVTPIDGDEPTAMRRTASGAPSKASSACPRPKATASTCCATATRSSRRCSRRSTNAEHTDRLPDVRVLGGRDRHRVRATRSPRARAAGVRVRVLLDAWGAHPIDQAAHRRCMDAAGVQRALVPAARTGSGSGR